MKSRLVFTRPTEQKSQLAPTPEASLQGASAASPVPSAAQQGFAENYILPAHWYRLAAAQGFADAQQRLADLYYLGQGVPRNYTQAAQWYRRAAEQGSARAQFQLGHLYDVGLGIEHDYTQYRYWTRKAAEQGHEDAVREVMRRDYRDP